ncbi:MAG TPA: VOC family protein [Pirellulales bacterium]|nr:VOC family protein [Pirellulales bacterium]
MAVKQSTESFAELYCVELRTGRWQELVAWYKNALGMRSLLRVDDDRYALLAAGEARLAIVGREEPSRESGPSDRSVPHESSGRWTLAFEVADLDVAIARLEGAGAEVLPTRLHPEGFVTVTTCDPDGNRVRLFRWPK